MATAWTRLRQWALGRPDDAAPASLPAPPQLPPPAAWRSAPPIQRSLGPMPTTLQPQAFPRLLLSHRNPGVLAPLAHAIDPHAPVGLVHDLAQPAQANPAAANTSVQRTSSTPDHRTVTWPDRSIGPGSLPVTDSPPEGNHPEQPPVVQPLPPAAGPLVTAHAPALPQLQRRAIETSPPSPSPDASATSTPPAEATAFEARSPSPTPSAPLLAEPPHEAAAPPDTEVQTAPVTPTPPVVSRLRPDGSPRLGLGAPLPRGAPRRAALPDPPGPASATPPQVQRTQTSAATPPPSTPPHATSLAARPSTADPEPVPPDALITPPARDEAPLLGDRPQPDDDLLDNAGPPEPLAPVDGTTRPTDPTPPLPTAPSVQRLPEPLRDLPPAVPAHAVPTPDAPPADIGELPHESFLHDPVPHTPLPDDAEPAAPTAAAPLLGDRPLTPSLAVAALDASMPQRTATIDDGAQPTAVRTFEPVRAPGSVPPVSISHSSITMTPPAGAAALPSVQRTATGTISHPAAAATGFTGPAHPAPAAVQRHTPPGAPPAHPSPPAPGAAASPGHPLAWSPGDVAISAGIAHRSSDGSVVFDLPTTAPRTVPASAPLQRLSLPPQPVAPRLAHADDSLVDHPAVQTVAATEPSGSVDDLPSDLPSPVTTADLHAPGSGVVAPSPSPTSTDPSPTGPAMPPVDELVQRLFDPLAARLRAELRLDRERAGLTTDLRR